VLLRFSASGTETSRIDVPSRAVNIASNGDVVAIRPDQGWTLLDAGGRERFRVDTLPTEFPFLQSTPGGELVDVRRQGNVYRLRRFDTTGAQLFDVALGTADPLVVVGTERVLVVTRVPQQVTLRLRAFDRSGSLAWERTLATDVPFATTDGITRAFALENGDFALIGVTRFAPFARFVVGVIDGASGADRLRTEEDCINCYMVPAISLDANGDLRVVVTGLDVATTGASRLLRYDLPEPRLGIDARSIAGAWYAPSLAGDGIVATFDPPSNTLFAAWFTYASPFSEGAAGQRWYSLQGTPGSAGASELVIYANRGGAFAQPPVTTAQAVGRATLRLIDCARAELEYVFDGTPSVRGRRTLRRLTDPGRCGATPPTARAGLDWRQSGAWFDPATSGQGVLLSIAPDTPVFAAWFTYDVGANADDPTQQQWLTLQSAGVPASATNIALDIYRTIGGVFDSRPAASTTRIGSARLSVDGCSRAVLSWQFDTSGAAGALSGLSGEQTLERLTACPP
jgi:hypothetical protein